MHLLTPQIAKLLAKASQPVRRLVFCSVEKLAEAPAGTNRCTVSVGAYSAAFQRSTEDAGMELREGAEQLVQRPPIQTLKSANTLRFEPALLSYEEQIVGQPDAPASVTLEWNPSVAEALQADFSLMAGHPELFRMTASAGYLLARAILDRYTRADLTDKGWMKFSIDELRAVLPPTRSQAANFGTYKNQVITPALKALRRQAGWSIDLKKQTAQRAKGQPVTLVRLLVSIP